MIFVSIECSLSSVSGSGELWPGASSRMVIIILSSRSAQNRTPYDAIFLWTPRFDWRPLEGGILDSGFQDLAEGRKFYDCQRLVNPESTNWTRRDRVEG